MPALKPTDHWAEVVWLGRVESPDWDVLYAEPLQQEVALTYAGMEGSSHAGETRASCVRVKSQFPEGTEIRNVRQLSVLSAEELDEIAAKMGLDAVDPARLGASLVLRGIPDFSHVPPSSRLQTERGTTLVVDMENRPCHFPGKSLDVVHPGKGKDFKAAAKDRRGVTAWVERPGPLAVGDRVRLHIPDQRRWSGSA